MTEERIEGRVRQGIGRAQDAVGGLTGDAGMQARGKLNQLVGDAQHRLGDVRERAQGQYRQVEAYTLEHPAQALAISFGLGVAVGVLLRTARA
jgi:uncharacterized protein YjbJ (UPF0337 family)